MIAQNLPPDKKFRSNLGTQEGHKADMAAYDLLLEHLPDVLSHLYDLRWLHDSPVASLFNIANRPDMASLLQRIIIEAIDSLKPAPDTPAQSRTWRIYELLFYRYVQQFSQREVADQVGLSVRHLRREQNQALEMLASRLWERISQENRQPGESTGSTKTGQNRSGSPTVSDELAWLKDAAPEKPVALAQMLPAVMALAQPLANQHGVRIRVNLPDTLPDLMVHPVALRQVVLSLLKVAVHRPGGNQVMITARSIQGEVEIRVSCPAPSANPDAARREEDEASLDMAHRLAQLCEGRLALGTENDIFDAVLVLPALEQLPVLVVDDNADTLQLLQRYAAGTRYRLIGTQDPDQILSLVKEFLPQIIILDVMMPERDGWEILGWLQQQPATEQIPVIVCTILAQEELALSLGAAAFIRKPVTGEALISALDRQRAALAAIPR